MERKICLKIESERKLHRNGAYLQCETEKGNSLWDPRSPKCKQRNTHIIQQQGNPEKQIEHYGIGVIYYESVRGKKKGVKYGPGEEDSWDEMVSRRGDVFRKVLSVRAPPWPDLSFAQKSRTRGRERGQIMGLPNPENPN